MHGRMPQAFQLWTLPPAQPFPALPSQPQLSSLPSPIKCLHMWQMEASADWPHFVFKLQMSAWKLMKATLH